MSTSTANLEDLAVNTIRVLSFEAVQKANCGHPGMPMGCADFAYVLWSQFLKVDPADADWPDRDRFVLSAGHGSMLLYAMLHLTGYDLSLDLLVALVSRCHSEDLLVQRQGFLMPIHL